MVLTLAARVCYKARYQKVRYAWFTKSRRVQSPVSPWRRPSEKQSEIQERHDHMASLMRQISRTLFSTRKANTSQCACDQPKSTTLTAPCSKRCFPIVCPSFYRVLCGSGVSIVFCWFSWNPAGRERKGASSQEKLGASLVGSKEWFKGRREEGA